LESFQIGANQGLRVWIKGHLSRPSRPSVQPTGRVP
jgi:hypothetical protein